MRISDWSSDVCSSDLTHRVAKKDDGAARRRRAGPVDEREKVGLDTREPAFAIVAERGCRERILAMPAMVDRRDVHPAADDRGERREIAACMLTHSVRDDQHRARRGADGRSEEHTSELQSLMRNSYADFALKKKNTPRKTHT